ncbi:alpha/beta hydrolase-fold protein [Bacteroidales bacterium]
MKTIHSLKISYPRFGKIQTIAAFASQYVKPRRIDVWLPDQYVPMQPHGVLYMHDGQNLFHPGLGYNGQSWAVDMALQPLIYRKQIQPVIVVGIWNTALRYEEYLPAPAFDLLPNSLKDHLCEEHQRDLNTLSDSYLNFIVRELKPYIDTHYPTISGKSGTSIMGSSMGGLISAYAIAAYPAVFGNAACLSTHWPLSLAEDELDFSLPFIHWLGEHLPDPESHRLYFDFGTETIDAPYERHQKEMDSLMRIGGYTEGQNWLTVKDIGADHSEEAWARRLPVPLSFLLR